MPEDENSAGRRLISIVVPVFDEVENVVPLYDAVNSVMSGMSDRYDHEFVFTDNHSTDGTFEALSGLAAADPKVRVFRFSRNFGYQRSILTGYRHARGVAAIQLDCDLQDPPRLIPEFVARWEQGYQVVYGVRRSRKEGWGITMLRKTFYRLIDFLSEDPLPVDAGDFRLVDRVIIDHIALIEDSQPYLRGTIATLGYNQTGLPYDREERSRGASKFTWYHYINLSIDGILNHSVLPLRLATYIGLAISFCTFCALVAYVAVKILYGQHWPAGFATTTIYILLSLSLNALFLGIIGEYLGRIYKQMKRNPVTIIEQSIDRT